MMSSERQIIVNHISGLFAEYAAIFAIDGNFDEVQEPKFEFVQF